MRTLQTEYTFAGFNFPRYLATLAIGHEALKHQRETRKYCGGYYHAPTPNANTGRGFYLGDAGQPFTRWEWADEVDGANIRHTGWFYDDSQCGKIRGIVAALPHGRYLAGWAMGEGMAATIEPAIYIDKVSAAYAADSLAEYAADREREYQAANSEE